MEAGTGKVAISVAMGVYNPGNIEELYQAVDSVLNQTFDEFELLLYDDASRPEVADALQRIAEKDGRIRLLRGEKNQGLAHALNECIKHAKGEYIARMDADDLSAPERFGVQKAFLDTNREYAFVGCNAELFDEKGVWGTWTMTERPSVKEFLRYSPYIHPSVMFRKEVLIAEGGYRDTEETRRCEDYELFMRLFAMGHHGYNIDKVLFSYREGREWQDKRKLRHRIAEMKIRYRGFRAMGAMRPKTWIYVIKPVVTAMIPRKICRYVRRGKAE